jgi:hypothetical protein
LVGNYPAGAAVLEIKIGWHRSAFFAPVRDFRGKQAHDGFLTTSGLIAHEET